MVTNTFCFNDENSRLVMMLPIIKTLLLLLLSCFSRVRLCATPETAAHQAPPSLGFSRQETGVGCHFLLQCMKVKSEREVAQSCPTLNDPMDCSLPGSSTHGIFQARVLEWGAIACMYQCLNKRGLAACPQDIHHLPGSTWPSQVWVSS